MKIFKFYFVLFICCLCILGNASAGDYNFAPYVDKNGNATVLVGDKNSGVSKLYCYDPFSKKFEANSYQLPQKPLGTVKNAKYYFAPYVDKNGNATVLVGDDNSGVSKLYCYDPFSKKFEANSYQLPQKPLGTVKNAKYYFAPYVDKNGNATVLVGDKNSGVSKLYCYDPFSKKFEANSYQLPQKLYLRKVP
jgi:hypothetical protein